MSKSLAELCVLNSFTLEDAIDFINIVYPICHGKKADDNITIKAFRNGYANPIIQYYMGRIEEDPKSFGLKITKLYDKQGNLIKQTIENESNSTV